MQNKNTYMYIGAVVIGLIIANPIYAINGNGQGRGQGQGNGQGEGLGRAGTMDRQNNKKSIENIVDENNNSIPDGQEDFDGDGIINRDDEDYEKEYLNMRDADGDGVANRIDEDYESAKDGTNRPEAVRQNRIQKQQQDTGEGVLDGVTSRNQNRATNRYNNENLGRQVREIARNQEGDQRGIAEEVAALKSENRFKRLFLGANQNSIKNAEARLERYEKRIVELKELVDNTTEMSDKEVINTQVEVMEARSIQLQEQIDENSGGFSLFGWITKLFN